MTNEQELVVLWVKSKLELVVLKVKSELELVVLRVREASYLMDLSAPRPLDHPRTRQASLTAGLLSLSAGYS